MRVLVACEFSGIVRDAFRRRGHTAFSCDILPSESLMLGSDGYHFQCNVLDLLAGKIPHDAAQRPWDLMIAHPPCAHLSVSGARHFAAKQASGVQQEALDFVRALMNAPIKHICIEKSTIFITLRSKPC